MEQHVRNYWCFAEYDEERKGSQTSLHHWIKEVVLGLAIEEPGLFMAVIWPGAK